MRTAGAIRDDDVPAFVKALDQRRVPACPTEWKRRPGSTEATKAKALLDRRADAGEPLMTPSTCTAGVDTMLLRRRVTGAFPCLIERGCYALLDQRSVLSMDERSKGET